MFVQCGINELMHVLGLCIYACVPFAAAYFPRWRPLSLLQSNGVKSHISQGELETKSLINLNLISNNSTSSFSFSILSSFNLACQYRRIRNHELIISIRRTLLCNTLWQYIYIYDCNYENYKYYLFMFC